VSHTESPPPPRLADLAVGAIADTDSTGKSTGAVYILYLKLRPKKPIESWVKISGGLGGFSASLTAGDNFGYSIASTSDLDCKPF
jgi:hypothetical protein